MCLTHRAQQAGNSQTFFKPEQGQDGPERVAKAKAKERGTEASTVDSDVREGKDIDCDTWFAPLGTNAYAPPGLSGPRTRNAPITTVQDYQKTGVIFLAFSVRPYRFQGFFFFRREDFS